MASINLSMFSDSTANLVSHPYDTSVSAEQPWVNTKFSLYDSDIEVRSVDGFIFQLHRGVLGATSGAFPGSEMGTGGEIVQLTEPANVLGILFAFLYPKPHPSLHEVSFEVLAAVAEAAAKYEVFSAVDVCNERLPKFVSQHAPEILAHAVKHDYPRLVAVTLPHFSRAPLVSVLERLPPSYMLPWARYHEAWRSLFKELNQYITNLPLTSGSCHSSSWPGPNNICVTCITSLNILTAHLEGIDTIATLRDTLRSPSTDHLNSVLKCCRHERRYPGQKVPVCSFVENVTALCESKIEKLPSFAAFLGLKL
ncbi:hypothetical protein AN958_11601 [Leucoagaricus sp. SymC.cos]|nr:hypothetical protein AN958_11601 [Leucoagaricus sp. SymC.cos]